MEFYYYLVLQGLVTAVTLPICDEPTPTDFFVL